MAAPPNFNPDASLLPDVKGSIGGVQGGGGQTTFLKDILIALKGSTIQYKNPNDTDPKSFVVGDIPIDSPAAVEETKEGEPALSARKDPRKLDAFTKINDLTSIPGILSYIKHIKTVLRSAVANTTDYDKIDKLVSLLDKMDGNKSRLINVAYSAATVVNKKNLINEYIRILEKDA